MKKIVLDFDRFIDALEALGYIIDDIHKTREAVEKVDAKGQISNYFQNLEHALDVVHANLCYTVGEEVLDQSLSSTKKDLN